MGFSWTCSTTIAFWLVSIAVQSFGELVLIRHPPKNDGNSRDLTCMSTDDNAALIWNYNSISSTYNGRNIITGFEPEKPILDNVDECAVWNSRSTGCVARWEKKNEWNSVESAKEPMGPASDYRWEGSARLSLSFDGNNTRMFYDARIRIASEIYLPEFSETRNKEGFKEFYFEKELQNEAYQYVGQVGISGTAVFSVRGVRSVYIFLCKKEEPKNSRCIWIITGSGGGTKSMIRSCADGVRDSKLPPAIANCVDLAEVTHGAGEIIDPYEWRTFRLKWKRTEKTIEVFKDNEDKPFLEGKLDKQLRVSHMSIRSEITTRVRFHFYKYFMTKHKNAVISTSEFQHNEQYFCVELLVALCAKCKLDVNLVDTKRSKIQVQSIIGDKNDVRNKLLIWRPVKLLTTNLPPSEHNITRLKIEIITKKTEGDGHWAIDKFRTCDPVGRLRESTITTEKDPATKLWPAVKCQKISYNEHALVDSASTTPVNHDPRTVLPFLSSWRQSCGPSCTNSKKKWSVCDSTGCVCVQEFTGSNCVAPIHSENQIREFNNTATTECSSGMNGNNCYKSCGSCDGGSCNKITKDCDTNCTNPKLLLPICNEETPPVAVAPDIRNLRVDRVSNTSTVVRLQWTPVSKNVDITGYTVSVKQNRFLGCENSQRPTAQPNVIHQFVRNTTMAIENLRPFASYTVTVNAHNGIQVGPLKSKDFQTQEADIPTSRVSNLAFHDEQFRLTWDKPSDCTTISSPIYGTRLDIVGLDPWVEIWNVTKTTTSSYFDLNTLRLVPFTRYGVRAYVVRKPDGPVNSTYYAELSLRTVPAAPPPVKQLKIYNANPDTREVSVTWEPPYPANGIIDYYVVSIGTENKFSKPWKLNNVNITFPQNAVEDNAEIKVQAKNRYVTQNGEPTRVKFVAQSHYKEPSRPENFTATADNRGNVTLKWAHPLISYARIIRFDIRVELLESNRKVAARDQVPTNTEGKKKEYTHELRLPPSKSYRIFVVAVNVNNFNSSEAQAVVRVPEEFAFASGEKLQVNQKGTRIELKVPTVVNATQNMTVSIIVTWSSLCARKQSRTSSSLTKKTEWVAKTYTPERNKLKILNFDLNERKDIAANCSLLIGKNSEIVAVVEDGYSKISDILTSVQLTSIGYKQNKKPNLVWLIIMPLIIALCLLLYCIYRRKRKSALVQVTYAEIVPLSKRGSNRNNLPTLRNQDNSTHPANTKDNQMLNHEYAIPFTPSNSSSVNVTYFEEYAKNAAFDGTLNRQYALFTRGLNKPCEYGRLPQNLPKNRSGNLIAYDDTRVVLEKIPGDPYSDYINANYIQGYGEEKAYIATQGPKPNTINDFWRMIWQEKVKVICMLANVIEDEKKMCEQYWPEVGAEVKHGDITISNTNHQLFADYTCRTFVLSFQKATRKVTHLHYTGWPDDGVPMYSQSLVAYLKKLVETLDGHGPVVMHCRDGDGRTGTIILCDMCVRQGIVERQIDVPTVAKRIYESRANMLYSSQQYLLAHVIITESIMSIATEIPCNEILPTRISVLRKQLPSHIERLNETLWQERALHAFTSPLGQIPTRLSSHGSPQLSQVYYEASNGEIYLSVDNDCIYTNAVSVDGIRVKKQYLASRLPQPSGLPDFWRFIAERDIKLVIILQQPDPNDPMLCDIMPGESILVPMSCIQVETKTSLNEEHFTIDELSLTYTLEGKTRPQSVTVLTCNGWGCGNDGKPPATAALVSLWRASENIPRNEGQTLVLCRDGVTSCGLYLALSFLLEKMAVERECDVISAVGAVRRSRKEYVQSIEQFEYLYDAAMNYAQCLQTYANVS